MGTFIVGSILCVILFFIIRSLIRRLKSGHGFCIDCQSCGHCASHADHPERDSSPQCTGSCASCGKCSSQQQKRH